MATFLGNLFWEEGDFRWIGGDFDVAFVDVDNCN